MPDCWESRLLLKKTIDDNDIINLYNVSPIVYKTFENCFLTKKETLFFISKNINQFQIIILINIFNLIQNNFLEIYGIITEVRFIDLTQL